MKPLKRLEHSLQFFPWQIYHRNHLSYLTVCVHPHTTICVTMETLHSLACPNGLRLYHNKHPCMRHLFESTFPSTPMPSNTQGHLQLLQNIHCSPLSLILPVIPCRFELAVARSFVSLAYERISTLSCAVPLIWTSKACQLPPLSLCLFSPCQPPCPLCVTVLPSPIPSLHLCCLPITHLGIQDRLPCAHGIQAWHGILSCVGSWTA